MPAEVATRPSSLDAISNGHSHHRQKRARSQLSCVPCRTGKLKCNRSHDPACDQCIKRNRESSCIYVPPAVKQKLNHSVNGRIRQLETLVVDLMNQQNTGPQHQDLPEKPVTGSDRQTSTARYTSSHGSEPSPPLDADLTPPDATETALSEESPDDVDGATTPFGQMSISRGEISYVGDAHWRAILNGISELKRDLEEVDDDSEGDDDTASRAQGVAASNGAMADHVPPPHCPLSSGVVPMGGIQPHATTGMGFVFGVSEPLTKAELISSMPEKKVTDRLLSLWFNSPDPFKPIIHAPTFQEEYRRFWQTPNDTPTMWLGLTFAIMSLAASFSLRDVHPADPDRLTKLAEVNKYHTLAASAAMLADFTKPKRYTVECLMIYTAGLRANTGFVNVWFMIGLIVRVALRMGYHRDSSKYSAITVFEGEMRRRVWSILSMIDVLTSFQLGLPSMVKTIYSDTLPPRNLLDRDFSTATKVLPAGRGIDELTPSSYTRAKLRIVRIFADASELSHATTAPSHETMMELDQKLDETKSQVPPLLQMPDISELVTDPAEQLMCRFNLDLLYLKAKIVLHRRYMEKPFSQLSPEEQRIGIGRSRQTCIECALRVLHHHHTIYAASQPGGQLESVKWYMGSISTHDFLLAAMVICLELSQQINGDAFPDPSLPMCPRRAAMMDALEKSQKIWSNASAMKRRMMTNSNKDDYVLDETEKASRSMAVMIEKVKAQFPSQPRDPNGMKNSPPPPPASVVTGKQIPVPAYVRQNLSQNSALNFSGVVSNYKWDSVAGVPDGMDSQSVLHKGTSTDSNADSGPLSNESGPQPPSEASFGPDFNQSDFTMIQDMLDVQGGVDWAAWDSTINQNEQMAFSDDYFAERLGTGIPDNSLANGPISVDMPGTDFPGSVPGDVSTLNGKGDNGIYPGSWMAFPSMSNVDFDMDSGAGYGQNGFWPG